MRGKLPLVRLWHKAGADEVPLMRVRDMTRPSRDKLFHDELEHLVRDEYMTPEKKLAAIEKLINRNCCPRGGADPGMCARCAGIEDAAKEMLSLVLGWGVKLCEIHGVAPTADEYPIQEFERRRSDLIALGVPGIPCGSTESIIASFYEALEEEGQCEGIR